MRDVRLGADAAGDAAPALSNQTKLMSEEREGVPLSP